MQLLETKRKIILLTLLLCSYSLLGQTNIASTTRWVGTWATAPQLVEPNNMPPSPGLTNNSLRQVVRVSIGGDTIRVKFSNEFSTSAVTMKSVQIAVSTGGSAIDVSTNKELKFNGSAEVTMNAGTAVTSDPIAFNLTPRMTVAITIYFGQTSSTVTGHPGSRTTSYIIAGNSTTITDFTGAVTADRWYVINGIDVLVPSKSACVAILGNSITDGRGSTTNMQNRWPDIFSESLLKDSSTKHVGVLNMGIGGNAVLSGGLGPTAVSRFDRDILNQSGVRWAIVFIGVNDIGTVTSATAATTMANNLINAYKQMIAKAHAKNIRIYGATITPFKGNSYYNQYSEACRNNVNQWIRTPGNFDACIDFDKIMRNPSDTLSLISSFQNDGLHPDAEGYKKMGESVDINLFTGADTVFQKPKSESIWIELERFVPSIGSKFNVISDPTASNGKYVMVQPGLNSTGSAPTEEGSSIVIPFAVTKDTTYNVFARVNCPTYEDDSFWVKIDNNTYVNCNGLKSNGWEWVKLITNNLLKGDHTLTIAYREDGACLDKLCITSSEMAPSGMGEADTLALSVNSFKIVDGFELKQNYPNPFNPTTVISYHLSTGQAGLSAVSDVNLRVYDILGKEVVTLVNKKQPGGNYDIQFNASQLASGVYFYKLTAGNFTAVKKLVLLR